MKLCKMNAIVYGADHSWMMKGIKLLVAIPDDSDYDNTKDLYEDDFYEYYEMQLANYGKSLDDIYSICFEKAVEYPNGEIHYRGTNGKLNVGESKVAADVLDMYIIEEIKSNERK